MLYIPFRSGRNGRKISYRYANRYETPPIPPRIKFRDVSMCFGCFSVFRCVSTVLLFWVFFSALLLLSAHLSPSSSSSFFFFLPLGFFCLALSLPLLFLLFLSFCLLLNGLMGSRHMIRIFNTLLHSFSLLVLRAHQLAHQLTQWCNKSLKLKNFQLFYILFIYFMNT